MNVCLILSSGASSRFQSSVPKQYSMLNGKEVIGYSIDAMRQSKSANTIIISADEGHADRLRKQYGLDVSIGGITRNQSIRNGLKYIKQNFEQCEKIFITEAARPFITAGLVDDYFCKLDNHDAVITAQHITDSLGKYGEAVTDRAKHYLIQAPEAFLFELLYQHFNANSAITATVQQLPPNSKIYLNFDFRYNLKLTYPEDLLIAEQLMRYLH